MLRSSFHPLPCIRTYYAYMQSNNNVYVFSPLLRLSPATYGTLYILQYIYILSSAPVRQYLKKSCHPRRCQLVVSNPLVPIIYIPLCPGQTKHQTSTEYLPSFCGTESFKTANCSPIFCRGVATTPVKTGTGEGRGVKNRCWIQVCTARRVGCCICFAYRCGCHMPSTITNGSVTWLYRYDTSAWIASAHPGVTQPFVICCVFFI